MNNAALLPRRILVIDDNTTIHEDFRKVLSRQADPSARMTEAANSLFGRSQEADHSASYEVEVAARGQDGMENVRRSQELGKPYALAFVDMRMPNGWNGIETIQQIWKIQPDLQIVICTAFSDFSWAEIRAQLHHSDRFLILKKPFDNIEVQQLAEALTGRYLAETILREQSSLLHEAQEIARIAHFSHDFVTAAWSKSPLLHEVLNLDTDSIRNVEHLLSLLTSDDDHSLAAQLKSAIADGTNFGAVLSLGGQGDSSKRWISARCRWGDNAGRNPSKMTVTVQDVSEIYAKQSQLRLLEACVAQMNDAVVITDSGDEGTREPRLVFVNDAFSRRTGHTPEDVLGRSISMLYGSATDIEVVAGIGRAMMNGLPIEAEVLLYTRTDEAYWCDIDIVPLVDSVGRCTHFVCSHRDITAQRQAQARIEHMAYHDVLTSLPNRRLLADRLQRSIASSVRDPVYSCLLFLDLDNFKEINDTYGHEHGDLLLKAVATRLMSLVREDDTVSRVGGDEFAILLNKLDTDTTLAAAKSDDIARKITSALSEPFHLADIKHHTTISAGMTLFGAEQSIVDDLFKRADIAMYQAKTSGKNTHRFFDASMQHQVNERSALIAELRQGLKDEQFALYYQPQFQSHGGLTGAEALLRWIRPDREPVSPAVFIPLAEQAGLISHLGNWVLDAACQTLVRWSSMPNMEHLTLAVNVSGAQFKMTDFVDTVLSTLKRTGARADRLKLELTESMLVHDLADVRKKMARLKAQGVSFSLDDFGTGYSSLSYLRELSIDQLKIDQSFVRDVLTDPNDATIVRAIVNLAQSLGMQIIAEGVETREQQDFLTSINCNGFQGYHFSRPLAASDFNLFVKNQIADSAL